MYKKIKKIFIILAIIISSPIFFIYFIIGLFTIAGLVDRYTLDPTKFILGTKLPKSASEVDYFYETGWDGLSGAMCATISQADFDLILQKLDLDEELERRGKLGDDRDVFNDPSLAKFALKCWVLTKENNPNTYIFGDGHGTSIHIRYENGKIFVVRYSS